MTDLTRRRFLVRVPLVVAGTVAAAEAARSDVIRTWVRRVWPGFGAGTLRQAPPVWPPVGDLGPDAFYAEWPVMHYGPVTTTDPYEAAMLFHARLEGLRPDRLKAPIITGITADDYEIYTGPPMTNLLDMPAFRRAIDGVFETQMETHAALMQAFAQPGHYDEPRLSGRWIAVGRR